MKLKIHFTNDEVKVFTEVSDLWKSDKGDLVFKRLGNEVQIEAKLISFIALYME